MRAIDRETGEEFDLYHSEELQRDLANWGEAAECLHESKELRKIPIAGGRYQIRFQCLRCGDGLGNPIARTQAPEDLQLGDVRLKERYRSMRRSEHEEIIQKHIRKQKTKDTEFWIKYNKYLLSNEWKARRTKILDRSGGLCEGCRERPATQVHHLSYRHVCNEFLFELVAVCDDCHSQLHPEEISEKSEGDFFEEVAA